MNRLDYGKYVLDTEARALITVRDHLDETFDRIVDLVLQCKGKLIFIGMGKSGHIGRKAAASFSSLGFSSFFVHPGEAMHGDLGMIQREDLVIVISYSGESSEITGILPNIRLIGPTVIGITGNENSTLAKFSDVTQLLPPLKEACHLGLAPTTSTTAALAYCDALAVTASVAKGFTKSDYGLLHPAGSLGKKLTYRVVDVMTAIDGQMVAREDGCLADALMAQCRSGLPIVPVEKSDGRFTGVISSRDLSKALISKRDIHTLRISKMCDYDAKYINSEAMAIDALSVMVENSLEAITVTRDAFVAGVITKSAILKTGIYI